VSLGFAVHVQTSAVKASVCKVAFPGVNGVFAQLMGTRGYVHHVDGVLYGATLAGLLLFSRVKECLSSCEGVMMAAVTPSITASGMTWAQWLAKGTVAHLEALIAVNLAGNAAPTPTPTVRPCRWYPGVSRRPRSSLLSGVRP
jgi:hypothetical protein